MKSVDVFEKGDEVFIKVEVSSVVMNDGKIQYEVKEPIGGNWLKHFFTADELVKKEQING